MSRILWPLFIVAGCSSTVVSPVEGSFACGPEVGEAYRVIAPNGGALVTSVDTIAAETAFDPALIVAEASSWAGTAESTVWGDVLILADDEVPCTFPPPEFQCPDAFTATGEDVGIIVFEAQSCASDVAEYELTVTLGGEPAELEWLGEISGETIAGFFPGTYYGD